jgi:hypothetical protein
MMRDVSKQGSDSDPIVDLDWLANPENMDFAGHANPNNIRPELAVQWGIGGGVDFSLDDSLGVVERNLPEDAGQETRKVIIFARDLMNQGYMGRDLTRALRAQFPQEALLAAQDGLREQFKLEGIVGCIAIDGRGYKDCRQALASAQNSPFKGFIRYVIGCECGDHQMLPRRSSGGLMDEVVESSGNPTDDFLAGEDKHETRMTAHCRSTMLPIMGQDIDPSEVDSGMIDLMRVTGLPEDEVKSLRKKSKTQKAFVQAAFRQMQANKEREQDSKYTGETRASDHIVRRSEMEVEVAPEVKREAVSVNAQPDRGFEVELTGTGQDMSDVMPVNEASDQLQVEIGEEFKAQEVDPSTFVEKEFEGSDEVELDEPRKADDFKIELANGESF